MANGKSIQSVSRRTFLRGVTAGVGLLGAAGFSIWAAPKVLRRFDRLDPANFALPPLASNAPGLASADLGKEPGLLSFWASWCPECIGEHDRLMTLARQGVRMIGVASMDEGSRARRFLDANGDPYVQTALDARGALLRGFGFRGVPGFVVLGADGALRLKHEGPLDDRIVATRILPALRAA